MITKLVIMQAVCDVTQVNQADILKRSDQEGAKDQEVCYARQLCMSLARKYTKESQAAIGRYYGKRDHATCLHAERTIQNELDIYPHKKLVYTEVQMRILEYASKSVRRLVKQRIDQLLKEYEVRARQISDELLISLK